VYVIKGVEGEAGYVKQSMKLPKSWDAKPLEEVLKLCVETYNKKHEPKLKAEEWHLERPRGSTLFPDDHVAAALSDYCDVWLVEGAVKYKGPPPGTAAALEAAEAEERKRQEEEAAKQAPSSENPDKAQWSVKVKCVSLDRGGMDVKSPWKEGDVARVNIEPHATVGMLKNRLGLMVGAHPKHQTITHPLHSDSALGDLDKLKDAMASDQVLLELTIKVPVVVKEIEEVSDDEGFTGPEPEDAPPEPSLAAAKAAATEADVDRQAEAKGRAEEALASGDLARALDLLSEAVTVAPPSATLLCKRGDLLLKLARPRAASLDAERALEKNPDSAKAYKLRAKARRKLGEYDLASADFGQAQRIDFDDSIVEEQSYVTNRAKKLRAKHLAEAEQLNENHKKEE